MSKLYNNKILYGLLIVSSFFFIFIIFLGCEKSKKNPEDSSIVESSTEVENSKQGQASQEQLYRRGQSVYRLNCIVCHNADPAKPGSIGPALLGSSHELIEARVLKGGYPKGYKPKSESEMMKAMAHLEPEIEALSTYLKGNQPLNE